MRTCDNERRNTARLRDTLRPTHIDSGAVRITGQFKTCDKESGWWITKRTQCCSLHSGRQCATMTSRQRGNSSTRNRRWRRATSVPKRTATLIPMDSLSTKLARRGTTAMARAIVGRKHDRFDRVTDALWVRRTSSERRRSDTTSTGRRATGKGASRHGRIHRILKLEVGLARNEPMKRYADVILTDCSPRRPTKYNLLRRNRFGTDQRGLLVWR